MTNQREIDLKAKQDYYIACHQHKTGCTCFNPKTTITHTCGRTCITKLRKPSKKYIKSNKEAQVTICPLCPCNGNGNNGN